MQVRRIQTPGDLPAALQQLDAEHDQKSESQQSAMQFLLFFGTEDPQSGQSWCPDCVVADPRIRRHLLAAEKSSSANEKIASVTLLECPVRC